MQQRNLERSGGPPPPAAPAETNHRGLRRSGGETPVAGAERGPLPTVEWQAPRGGCAASRALQQLRAEHGAWARSIKTPQARRRLVLSPPRRAAPRTRSRRRMPSPRRHP